MQIPLRRKVLYSLAVLVGIMALLEGVMWAVDAKWEFRRRLLTELEMRQILRDPIPAEDDAYLKWRGLPDGVVLVRGQDGPSIGKPRKLPGRGVFVQRKPARRLLAPAETSSGKQVFIVGGSAAFGNGVLVPETFPAILDERLRKDGYEVHNCGQRGWASGQVHALVGRILHLWPPDTIVIFSGNNEWIIWAPKVTPTIRTRLRPTLAHSRALAAFLWWTLDRGISDTVMAQGGFQVHRELTGFAYALQHPMEKKEPTFDPQDWLKDKERFLRAFDANLAKTIDAAKARNVRVILLTVPFSYKLSPAWNLPQPESFDPVHHEAVRSGIRETALLIRQKQYRPALQRIASLLALDAQPPILHYMRGYCLEALGEPVKAEAAYAQCREHMVGNLGGRLSINARIRKRAELSDVILLDLQKIFADFGHSKGRYFNEDLIYDDCHLSSLGHRVVADALQKQIRAAR